MFVPTRSSQLKPESQESFTSVTRESSYKGKKRKSEIPKNERTNSVGLDTNKEKEMDLKKIRYEIIKFGTSGFDSTKKEENRVALAVALGARPPKNKKKNYKEVLAEKKREKEKLEVHKKINPPEKVKRPYFVSGKKVFRSRPSVKKQGTKGLLDVYGKVTNPKVTARRKK